VVIAVAVSACGGGGSENSASNDAAGKQTTPTGGERESGRNAPGGDSTSTVQTPDATGDRRRARASIPLPRRVQARLKAGGFWHRGCPVPRSRLRLLTVSYRGFDRQTHTGQLIVNQTAARPLARVFRQLYRLHFPIRHMTLSEVYGPRRTRPTDGDLSGSFECRQAVPSPCTGGQATGSWSMHAYGLAVDLNPVENPYVGCGQSRDRTARRYRDRSRHRRGMVTPRVIEAFRSIGWGWGGAWSGNTKDYMHFSATGR
jgi:D-alanyl-D-alanine carboxypeptidase